jgi:uncharacterized protein YdhG (YjbR/CyaY superfamily)
MKTEPTPKNIDAYIAGFPREVRAVLARVRSTIRKAMPGAQEAISYRIPTYKLHGKPVLYFAGWREHYSLYPFNGRVAAAFKDQVAGYKTSKGTIQFPIADKIPVKLIEGIARFRAKEAANGATKKAATPKRR